jgi:hypothetical protein
MAMQAVLDGVGIAAAQPLYVTDALATGRLVAPFPIVATKHEAWYLQYRPVRGKEPALLAFRAWLHGEAERQRQIEAEMIKRPLKATEHVLESEGHAEVSEEASRARPRSRRKIANRPPT